MSQTGERTHVLARSYDSTGGFDWLKTYEPSKSCVEWNVRSADSSVQSVRTQREFS